ncbi:MAG: hypothetical protein GY724_01030, partial [Actinomycetia bacterium]|nr:hypothetical protein [Actinomycetes bacterium]
MPSAFEPVDDRAYEPTPALLAAKAEPLGEAKTGRAPARSKANRSSKPGRAPKAGAPRPGKPPAGPSKARSRRSGGRSSMSSKMVAGIVGGVALLAVGLVAFLLTRGSDESDPGFTLNEDGVSNTSISAETVAPAVDEATTTTAVVAAPAASLPAVVSFDEAAIGPIQSETEYQVGIQDGPGSALYRLLIDGEPQAEPAPQLPLTVFTPGRHLLVVEITSPEGDVATDPVVVYALGSIPAASFRANLSSVHIETEGWREAVRQFDEFVAAGHTEMELMPSDWFPSLVPGYWNLFVDGFATGDEALAYCAQFELAVPDDCFAVHFDPDAPAGG